MSRATHLLRDAQARHSFTAWLSARYAHSTVHTTLLDVQRIDYCVGSGEELHPRLRSTVMRLRAWDADVIDKHPKRATIMALVEPKPRKTRRARERGRRPVERFQLSDAQRRVIYQAARAVSYDTHPAHHAIAVLANEGIAISKLLTEPLRADGRTWAQVLSPRGKRVVGAGGAYQKLRRTWPFVLAEARARDKTIPETLSLGDLEK